MSQKEASPITFTTYFYQDEEYVTKWESYANGGSWVTAKSPTSAEYLALQEAKKYFDVQSKSYQRCLHRRPVLNVFTDKRLINFETPGFHPLLIELNKQKEQWYEEMHTFSY